ncbi:unnamed protein product [Cochlearia groenlandica]
MAAGEVAVRRERDAAEENESTTAKRRKTEEDLDVESRIILSPCVQATNRGGIAARNNAGASETTVVILRRRESPVEEEEEEEEQCQIQIHNSDFDDRKNRSEEKTKRKIDFVDNNGGDETETSRIYDNLNIRESYGEICMEIQSPEDSSAVESRRRLKVEKKTVKEAEVEEFFLEAEKNLRDKVLECSTKYNFDFEKDEPFGGRFEWVKLN